MAVALMLLLCVGACGGAPARGIRVTETVPRLEALLRANDVRTGDRHPAVASIRSAWAAFKQFAATPIASGELSDDPMSDGLLFEFGTFDFGGRWGKSFEMSFVRQLGMRNGDLQQIHLVIHFRPAVFERLRQRLAATRCNRGAMGCVVRCTYADDQGVASLLGTPCFLAVAAPGSVQPRTLSDANVWSFDTGGDGQAAKRKSWIAFTESSPLFRLVVAQHVQPVGFEVWRDKTD